MRGMGWCPSPGVMSSLEPLWLHALRSCHSRTVMLLQAARSKALELLPRSVSSQNLSTSGAAARRELFEVLEPSPN